MAVCVPDASSEARRDLMRAREAAKQDELRARHRLGKFLLRPTPGVRPWTHLHLIWVSQMRFTQIAQESTRLDYLHEVEHVRERFLRLEQAIVEAVILRIIDVLCDELTNICKHFLTSCETRKSAEKVVKAKLSEGAMTGHLEFK